MAILSSSAALVLYYRISLKTHSPLNRIPVKTRTTNVNLSPFRCAPSTTSKLKLRPTASSEETPGELTEDSKFVPLNAEDPVFGPPALLLLGFEVEEAGKIQQLLKEMGGEFMEIIYCTEDMISRSLWEAMHTKQPNLERVKIAKSVPRICFLSGLSGEEMMLFIDAFPEAGLEPAVFAAMVPNGANKSLEELIEEIMGDHEMMTVKGSVSQ